MTWNLISLFLLCPLFWTSKFQGFSTILSTALTLHYCKNAVIYIYIPTSELVFIQDWQILSKCLRKKPKFGFYWQIKPTRFLCQKKNWQKNVKLTRNCSERHSLAIDVLYFPIMFSKWRWRIDLPWVQNIWFISPLVPSKREKNILVLLSLSIFWGKCVYFSIFENWKFTIRYVFYFWNLLVPLSH